MCSISSSKKFKNLLKTIFIIHFCVKCKIVLGKRERISAVLKAGDGGEMWSFILSVLVWSFIVCRHSISKQHQTDAMFALFCTCLFVMAHVYTNIPPTPLGSHGKRNKPFCQHSVKTLYWCSLYLQGKQSCSTSDKGNYRTIALRLPIPIMFKPFTVMQRNHVL